MLQRGEEDRAIAILNRIEADYIPCLTRVNYMLAIKKLLS